MPCRSTFPWWQPDDSHGNSLVITGRGCSYVGHPITFKTKYTMLYKNGEQYRLTPQETKAIEAYFHNKFPVKVVYPADRVMPSRLKHNKLPDKPQSISFDFRAIVRTTNGSEEWRYADNVISDKNGNKRYFPKKFLFNGSRYLDRADIEIIFFLLKKSTHRLIPVEELKENKELTQSKLAKFMFEDLVSEAEKKAEKKKIEAKIVNLLYGDDFGLPEEKLRALAKAYQITGVDNYTLAQVKMLLDNKIHATNTSADDFFRMVDAEDEIKTRVSITRAMDLNLLKFNDKTRQWFWQAEGEKGTTNVCRVPPDKSPSQALYDYYQGNAEFRDDIQAVLLTKNPDAGKAVKGKKEVVIEE